MGGCNVAAPAAVHHPSVTEGQNTYVTTPYRPVSTVNTQTGQSEEIENTNNLLVNNHRHNVNCKMYNLRKDILDKKEGFF